MRRYGRFSPQHVIDRRVAEKDARVNREMAARQKTPLDLFILEASRLKCSVSELMQRYEPDQKEGERAWELHKSLGSNPHARGCLAWAAWEMGFRAAEVSQK